MIELLENELTAAKRVSLESQRRYRGYIEADDVYQELVIWMLNHEDKVRQWREGTGYRALYKTLSREAHRVCEVEKAARVGYDPSDQQFYSRGLVKELLPKALDEDWEWSSETLAVMLIDVRRGLELIDEKAAAVLRAAVEEDWDYGYLAKLYSTSDEPLNYHTVYRRVERALGKLVAVLGGQNPRGRTPQSIEEVEDTDSIPQYRDTVSDTVQKINETGWV